MCVTKVDEEFDYCLNCAWEFEYYFDELAKSEQKRYSYRLGLQKNIYTQYLFLKKENKKLLETVERLKQNIVVQEPQDIVPLFKKSFFFEPEMVRIKGGSFMMGSDVYSEEQPIHKVTINYDFEIGKYPVTFEEYDYYCDEVREKKVLDSGFGRGKRPVINVSWNDAKAYTRWLSKKTGKSYRLPTEAEWEFVARAGTQTRWSFGDNENSLQDYAWYKKNSYYKGEGHKDYGTQQVGRKKANPWGVHDMHGNVWEWCEDWYMDNYEKTPIDGTIQGNNKGLFFEKIVFNKVVRGGSWYDYAYHIRSASRHRINPTNRGNSIGFRLQRTLP